MAQAATYTRRRPELDPLHRILSEHLLTFVDQSEHKGAGCRSTSRRNFLGT